MIGMRRHQPAEQQQRQMRPRTRANEHLRPLRQPSEHRLALFKPVGDRRLFEIAARLAMAGIVEAR